MRISELQPGEISAALRRGLLHGARHVVDQFTGRADLCHLIVSFMGYARHTIGHAPPIRLACRGSLDSVLVFSGCLGWVVSIGTAHLGRFGGVLAALVPRADRVGGGRLFGLGIGGWPRMDVRGTWWSIGTGLNGQLDLFSAIRGAHRLTMVCNLIQTTLGLVWLFPKFFPTTLWFIIKFLDRLQTFSVVRLSYLIDPSFVR